MSDDSINSAIFSKDKIRHLWQVLTDTDINGKAIHVKPNMATIHDLVCFLEALALNNNIIVIDARNGDEWIRPTCETIEGLMRIEPGFFKIENLCLPEFKEHSDFVEKVQAASPELNHVNLGQAQWDILSKLIKSGDKAVAEIEHPLMKEYFQKTEGKYKKITSIASEKSSDPYFSILGSYIGCKESKLQLTFSKKAYLMLKKQNRSSIGNISGFTKLPIPPLLHFLLDRIKNKHDVFDALGEVRLKTESFRENINSITKRSLMEERFGEWREFVSEFKQTAQKKIDKEFSKRKQRCKNLIFIYELIANLKEAIKTKLKELGERPLGIRVYGITDLTDIFNSLTKDAADDNNLNKINRVFKTEIDSNEIYKYGEYSKFVDGILNSD
ncbi:MAG: hypothetical protein KAI72_10680 [Candidatus Pacebacteria bacterium]|nr:hypothetical protein [Candidatus Paceibacterota bacterium]